MAYLGRQPVPGAYLKLDDISSSFNSAQTVFNLTSSSVPVIAGTARNLIISVGGVLQEPESAYTISGSIITFTGAPAVTQPFFGVVLGSAVDVGTLSAGVDIAPRNISASGNLSVSGNTIFSGTVTGVGAIYTYKTTTYSAVSGDFVGANGTFTVTLPPAVGSKVVYVKNIGTGVITVTRAGSDTIDGTTTFVLSPNDASGFQSDGTSLWFIF